MYFLVPREDFCHIKCSCFLLRTEIWSLGSVLELGNKKKRSSYTLCSMYFVCINVVFESIETFYGFFCESISIYAMSLWLCFQINMHRKHFLLVLGWFFSFQNYSWTAGKGQLISKLLFGVFNSPIKRNNLTWGTIA